VEAHGSAGATWSLTSKQDRAFMGVIISELLAGAATYR
jgi:hypothetical protein